MLSFSILLSSLLFFHLVVEVRHLPHHLDLQTSMGRMIENETDPFEIYTHKAVIGATRRVYLVVMGLVFSLYALAG